jgi:hypothetical protein
MSYIAEPDEVPVMLTEAPVVVTRAPLTPDEDVPFPLPVPVNETDPVLPATTEPVPPHPMPWL